MHTPCGIAERLKNIFALKFATVNVSDLTVFEAGARVDEAMLRRSNLVKGRFDAVKILGDGEIDRPLTVVAQKFTKSASDKIAAAGGTAVTEAVAHASPARS